MIQPNDSTEVPGPPVASMAAQNGEPAPAIGRNPQLGGDRSLPGRGTMDRITWPPTIARYRDLVAPTTEAPLEFHLSTLLAAFGTAVGRRAWIEDPHRTYPNLWILNVGYTADDKKSTAAAYGIRLLEDLRARNKLRVKVVQGIASVEGLALAMRGRSDESSWQLLVLEDELRSLLKKSQTTTTGNIIPKLTELYHLRDRFEINTRKDAILIDRPFLSLLANTTWAWLTDSLKSEDVFGGFLNRWCIFSGAPGEPNPRPRPPEEHCWNAFVDLLANRANQAQGKREFSAQADEVFSSWYRHFKARRLSEEDRAATARVDAFASRLAFLSALIEGRHEITATDMEFGIAVAEFCGHNAALLVPAIGLSPIAAAEKRLLKMLKAHGSMTHRHAQQYLHISAAEFNRMVQELQRIGSVRSSEVRRNSGQTSKIIELNDEDTGAAQTKSHVVN